MGGPTRSRRGRIPSTATPVSRKTMRAVVLDQFGEPSEVLQVREVSVKDPGRGEVGVRMLASPVNPSELMAVRGRYGRRLEPPATPGFEGVGIVHSSGGGLWGRWLVGKRVAVLNRGGGNWAERAVVPARQAVPVSGEIPVEQAAMFFVNPATAFTMTRCVLRVPRDAWLLQTAAASALGQMVIRLGRRFGFRTLNVVRRDEQAEKLRRLGADEVVVFDPARHEPEELNNQVRQVAGGSGVRFAIDPVGGATASAVVSCLGEGGRLLLYGTLSDEPISFSPRTLMSVGARVEGFWLARWMQRQATLDKLRLVKSIGRLMREGVLVSQVERTYRLDEIAEAVRAAERPGRSGKVLLRIAD